MSLEKFNHYLIQKGQNETLSTINAAPWEDIPSSKKAALEELDSLRSRLSDLQRRFFVDRSKKLLVVLQGMDTSGKNSTIRHVFRGVNPQGVHVSSFEKPTKSELRRRSQRSTFSRSHSRLAFSRVLPGAISIKPETRAG